MAKSHRSTSISFSTQSKKAQQKTRAQLAELAVVSEITGYSIEALIERAFDNFLGIRRIDPRAVIQVSVKETGRKGWRQGDQPMDASLGGVPGRLGR